MNTKTLKITRENIVEILFNKMFELIDSKETYDSIIKTTNPLWYEEFEWTKEKEAEFKKFAVNAIKKALKLSVKFCELEYEFFTASFGPRIIN